MVFEVFAQHCATFLVWGFSIFFLIRVFMFFKLWLLINDLILIWDVCIKVVKKSDNF
jgi:hypothetical protein